MVFFTLGIHNHQPVGNFQNIFEEAFRKAYSPLLETLALYPAVKASFHYSGTLLEWLEDNHPKHLNLLGSLVEKKQVEIIGGAFYEPILSVIPDKDKIGQIKLMIDFHKDRFGVDVKGMWVPERVWEPTLPKFISRAGLKYIILDDTHFLSSGLQKENLSGYYITEDEGEVVYAFPIIKELRYSIPFKPVRDVLALLKKVEYKGKLITMADDGEKFGVWPDTYEWVVEKGWLKNFFKALSEDNEIKTITFSEALEMFSPAGRIYLGTSSYRELSEWALPAESSRHLTEIYNELEIKDPLRLIPYIKGGFWRNFLSKYRESNYLHKKMLYVSSLVNNAFADGGDKAYKELYKGQTNCPYWHGVFGGLYLPHLREGVLKALLKAERLAESSLYGDEFLRVEKIDLDADGKKEVLLSTPFLTLFLSPDRGGTIYQFDLKEKGISLSSIIGRREEAYHNKLKELPTEEKTGAKSIHELHISKEKELHRFLIYDNHPRESLIDNVLNNEISGKGLMENKGFNSLYAIPYSVSFTEKGVSFSINQGDWWINKSLEPSNLSNHIKLNYEHNLPSLGVEFNLGFLSTDSLVLETQNQKYIVDEPGQVLLINSFRLRDNLRNFTLVFQSNKEYDLFYYPVYTVSLSEGGLERVFQGLSLMLKIPQIFNLYLEVNDEI